MATTASLYFKGADDLLLLKWRRATLESAGVEVRFEEAAPPGGTAVRAGAFPHAYAGSRRRAELPYTCLAACYELPRVDGGHRFPDGAFARERD